MKTKKTQTPENNTLLLIVILSIVCGFLNAALASEKASFASERTHTKHMTTHVKFQSPQ